MTDPEHPDQVTELPDDPRFPGHGQRDYFEFARRLQLLADKDIVLRVRRGTGANVKDVDAKVAPMYRLDLGVIMQMGPIMAVRETAAAAKLVQAADAESKLRGDVIEAVEVTNDDGKPLVFKEKPAKDTEKRLDPVRLPFELRQWSDRLDKAQFKGKRTVRLHMSRPQPQEGAGPEKKKVPVELLWDTDWRFDRILPLSPNSPMPIPELGIAYQVRSVVMEVTKKDSPFKIGDRIINIKAEVDNFKDEAKPGTWGGEEIEEGQWAFMSSWFFLQPLKFKKMEFKVKREKEEKEFEIPIEVDTTWPLADRGWLLADDTRLEKASTPLQAVEMGLRDTRDRMWDVFQSMRGLFSGRIALKRTSPGPLSIANAAYRFAGRDFGEFVFFLGLISINLAVVNFLPIPVLDGGHMVFLLYEKLRRKPASEGVRSGATIVGLAMILCLMVFVFYQDIRRIFFSG